MPSSVSRSSVILPMAFFTLTAFSTLVGSYLWARCQLNDFATNYPMVVRTPRNECELWEDYGTATIDAAASVAMVSGTSALFLSLGLGISSRNRSSSLLFLAPACVWFLALMLAFENLYEKFVP
jgi:hypothetical protein